MMGGWKTCVLYLFSIKSALMFIHSYIHPSDSTGHVTYCLSAALWADGVTIFLMTWGQLGCKPFVLPLYVSSDDTATSEQLISPHL